jgi:putative endonuclease
MKGYMYILKCANDSYYTGSTKQLDIRIAQHQAGEGANHTKKYGPVELVYFEEYDRIDTAFYREKQIQGWSRKKKEMLISGKPELLPSLAECQNGTHCKNIDTVPSTPLSHQSTPKRRRRSLSGAEVPKPR